jgi:hypothetical protein
MHKIVSKKFDQNDWSSGDFEGELEFFSAPLRGVLLMDQSAQVIYEDKQMESVSDWIPVQYAALK